MAERRGMREIVESEMNIMQIDCRKRMKKVRKVEKILVEIRNF
jgi:hypothetical protein